MAGKYTLFLYSLDQYTNELHLGLVERLKKAGIFDKTEIFSHEIQYIDYGINPPADSDCRTYIKVKSPNNREIFQDSDVLIRTGHLDRLRYLDRVVAAVQSDIKSPLPARLS